MRLHFFIKPTLGVLSEPEKKIIELLVRFRYENYSTRFMSLFNEADYPNIKTLINKLGEKILRANSTDPLQFSAAKIRGC